MSKFLNFFEKYEKIKSPIQIIIYIAIGIGIVSTIIGVIFGLRSCSKPEVTEAKYFISDEIIFHENYQIQIVSAKTVSSIEILKDENENGNTIKEGKYISIELILSKNEDSSLDEHKLDQDDFKLKDHTGLYIPLNTIMSFFNIDAIDMHIDTDENGFIRSDIDFSTRKCVKDYNWLGKTVTKEPMYLTIYFEMNEGYKVEEEIMIFEVDFYIGKSGIKKGEDIVLVKCVKSDV